MKIILSITYICLLLLLSRVLVCLSIAVDGVVVIVWTVWCVDTGISFSQLFEKLQAGSIHLF